MKKGSIIELIDNSGGKTIWLLNNTEIGAITKGIVKKAKANKKVKRGTIVHTLITTSKIGWKKKDGWRTTYFKNLGIVLKKNVTTKAYQPVGTRILRPFSRKLKKDKNFKSLSIIVRWV